jgi:IPT/TIG domain-containing protein
MITMRAVRQGILPGFIVAGVLAASVLIAPAVAIKFNLTACSYGYLGAPTVTGIAPTSGSSSGGTVVTITGCGFTGATSVHFGANAATGVTVTNDSTVMATSPAGAGTVHVDVTTPAGTSAHTAADQFTYGAAPCTGATAVANSSGNLTTSPAGFVINIQGTAIGCTHPLFAFFLLNPGGSWTKVQDFSARNNMNWDTGNYGTPEPAGTYNYSVWVRDTSSAGTFDGGASGRYDAFAGHAFPLTSGTCASVTATAAPSSPKPEGTTVTITATAGTCYTFPLFEFWILAPGSSTWQLVQGYEQFNNTFTWFTFGTNGTYRYAVWVRDFSSPGAHPQFLSTYDAFFPGAVYTLS